MLLHLRTCCKPGTRIYMHPALHHGRGNSRYLLQTSLCLVSDSDRRLSCVFFLCKIGPSFSPFSDRFHRSAE